MATKKSQGLVKKYEEKIKSADLKTIDSVISEIESSELSVSEREDLLIDAGVKVNQLKQTANINPEKEVNAYREAERKAMDESIKSAPKPSEKKWVKYKDDDEVNGYYANKRVLGHDPAKKLVLLLSSFALAFMVMFQSVSFAAVAMTDEAVLGNKRWRVTSGGHLIPATNAAYTIGDATASPSSIWVGGSEYTSFAAGSDGNWTDQGATLTLDQAPTKFIATYSSGEFFATAFSVGAGDITFVQGGKIDGDTANEIRLIENSDTLKIGFSGNDITVDTTDGGIIFALTDATDGTVDFQTNNDTDDYIQISTTTNQSLINFVGQNGKITAESGSIDFDNENLTTTGTLSAGATTATSFIVGDDTIDVVVDDVMRFASNDEKSTIEAFGFEAKAAALRLTTDEGDDAGDTWEVIVEEATDSLLFTSDAAVDNTQATILTLSGVGLLTTTGDIVVAGATPLVTIGDGGDEDIGIQFNSDTNDFYVSSENGADDFVIGLGSVIGTTPIISLTDTGVTEIRGSTDGDLTVYGAGTTASDVYLRLVADAGADASDRWQFFNDSSAGNLIFQNDSSIAGTYVTKLTLGSDGLITLVDSESITNATDQITFSFDDAAARVNIFAFEATDASIFLQADQSDDSGDDWKLNSVAADNTFTIGNDVSGSQVVILELTTAGVGTLTGSTDGDLTIYGAGATASDAYLRLVGDAGADASDRWQFFNDSSAGTLYIQSDISVAGTYVTLASVDANGDWVHSGVTPKITIGDAGEEDTSVVFDGNAQDFAIGLDDSADKLVISLGAALGTTNRMAFNSGDLNIVIGDASAADVAFIFDGNAADFSFGLDDSGDTFSLSLGSVLGTTEVFKADGTTMTVTDALAVDGVFTTTGTASTLGNAIGDITTFTGKIAGASPMSFDGSTADTVYTILAFTDPTSASKTITIPAVTGEVELKTTATTVITADTTATITVVPGTDTFYTYTIDTDNEDCTLTFSAGGTAGDRATIMFITDAAGSNDEIMTFETTLANPEGTLTLANVASDRYVISFISDGTVWNEISRTLVLTT